MFCLLTRLAALAGLFLTLAAPGMARADAFDGVASAELRPGWRLTDGTHVAALHIVLEPGWKTYWRAPGDAGIPPRFDWTRSRNVASVAPQWPVPEVFIQQGMRSIGYAREVMIPLRVAPRQDGAAMRLDGVMELGVCKDICLPASLALSADLPQNATRPDPRIVGALADMPFSAREAGVRNVTCLVEPSPGGGLALRLRIAMPRVGGREVVVVETGNPQVWVAEPRSRREGGALHASTRLVHVEGRSFALDRSRVRITVLGARRAVDIRGCTG